MIDGERRLIPSATRRTRGSIGKNGGSEPSSKVASVTSHPSPAQWLQRVAQTRSAPPRCNDEMKNRSFTARGDAISRERDRNTLYNLRSVSHAYRSSRPRALRCIARVHWVKGYEILLGAFALLAAADRYAEVYARITPEGAVR